MADIKCKFITKYVGNQTSIFPFLASRVSKSSKVSLNWIFRNRSNSIFHWFFGNNLHVWGPCSAEHAWCRFFFNTQRKNEWMNDWMENVTSWLRHPASWYRQTDEQTDRQTDRQVGRQLGWVTGGYLMVLLQPQSTPDFHSNDYVTPRVRFRQEPLKLEARIYVTCQLIILKCRPPRLPADDRQF